MKSLQIELHRINLLLWPPICRNKRAITSTTPRRLTLLLTLFETQIHTSFYQENLSMFCSKSEWMDFRRWGANLTKSQKITGLFVPIVSFVSVIYSANNKITITKWSAPMRFTSWFFLIQRFGLNFRNSVKLTSVIWLLFVISFFGLIWYKVIYILGLLMFV